MTMDELIEKVIGRKIISTIKYPNHLNKIMFAHIEILTGKTLLSN